MLTFVRKQAQPVFLRIHSFFCIDNARHPCFLFTYPREYCINYVYNTHIHSFYRNCQSIFLQNGSKFYIAFADFRFDFCLFYLSYFYFSPFSLCNSLKLNNYTYIIDFTHKEYIIRITHHYHGVIIYFRRKRKEGTA